MSRSSRGDDAVTDEPVIDDAVIDAAVTDDDADAGPGNARTVPVGVFVLAVLVAGILGVLAVVALSLDRGGDDGGDDAAARSAAGQYAERFLALSNDGFDAWLEDMRSIGTAGFGESVGRREAELRTLVGETDVTWQGTAVDVFTTARDDGVVSAMVLYDLQVTDTEGTRTIPDQYLRMDLVEATDGWLIERVISITGGSSVIGGGTDAAETPDTVATTTTAPGG